MSILNNNKTSLSMYFGHIIVISFLTIFKRIFQTKNKITLSWHLSLVLSAELTAQAEDQSKISNKTHRSTDPEVVSWNIVFLYMRWDLKKPPGISSWQTKFQCLAIILTFVGSSWVDQWASSWCQLACS